MDEKTNVQIPQESESWKEFKRKLTPGMLFRGNLDPSLTMKNVYETELYWVRGTVKQIDPETGETTLKPIIKAYRREDWRNFQQIDNDKGIPGYWWQALAHFESMELLHNPALTEDIEELRIK